MQQRLSEAGKRINLLTQIVEIIQSHGKKQG